MAHEPFPDYPSLADAIEDAEKVTVRWGHDKVRHLSAGQVAAIVSSLRAPVSERGRSEGDERRKDNWTLLVKEYAPKIGRTYKANWGPGGKKDYEYRFFGLVHGDDDYYYGMVEVGSKVRLLSCVGNIEGFGFEEIPQSAERNGGA